MCNTSWWSSYAKFFDTVDTGASSSGIICSRIEEEKDFSTILADFQQYEHGECVYCNHCLPCPAAIDIGQTLRFLDMAQQRVTTELKAAYNALSAKASDCTECKACETRCPFGVHVIPKMQQAVALFETS